MRKKILVAIIFSSAILFAQGQELQARISIISVKISSTVNKSVFQTLQTALTNFINNRKWTNDVFTTAEKIQCNFLLNIEESLGNDVYRAKLTIQAARPVRNTSYNSPIINFLDDDVVFRYAEFQPIEFNENRVQGNDPVAANLTAILAYYVDIILGFDYDSFSLRGGDIYFQKAWNIVNNAPESGSIKGWKSFEGLRNRYWLAENLNNNRFALIHDVMYSYYRGGLDRFYESEDEARKGVMNCLNYLSSLDKDNPNSMILQFFFQGKSNEMVKVFSHASVDLKTRAREILMKIDISNAEMYKELK
jgi:hypothetical protein